MTQQKNKEKIESLDMLFSPRSIAVIGASRNTASVGYGIAKNLIEGCAFKCKYCNPFEGKIYLINPKAEKILGRKCYNNIDEIEKIDLAIIVVPA
ncbi:MAG: CoA-binding protein, partial [Nanoarchaeota archaeon]|nr:CoA-binding protein [Nanoarchaeota archaeon]